MGSKIDKMQSDSSIESDNKAKISKLEIRKLELEVATLKRPWHKKPLVYVNIIIAISALIGVIGQSHLSNIKAERTFLASEQAKKEMVEALETKRIAEESTKKAMEEEKRAKVSLAATRGELNKVMEEIKGMQLVSTSRWELITKEIIGDSNRRRVLNIIADKVGRDIYQLGMRNRVTSDLWPDELDIIEVVMALEDEFNIDIPDEDVDRLETVGDVVRYIEKKLK